MCVPREQCIAGLGLAALVPTVTMLTWQIWWWSRFEPGDVVPWERDAAFAALPFVVTAALFGPLLAIGCGIELYRSARPVYGWALVVLGAAVGLALMIARPP